MRYVVLAQHVSVTLGCSQCIRTLFVCKTCVVVVLGRRWVCRTQTMVTLEARRGENFLEPSAWESIPTQAFAVSCDSQYFHLRRLWLRYCTSC